jgi:hypothetical protein
VSVTAPGTVGSIEPTSSRSGLAFRISQVDVEQVVVDHRNSTVQLLASRRFGAITLHVLGGAVARLSRTFDSAGYPVRDA